MKEFASKDGSFRLYIQKTKEGWRFFVSNKPRLAIPRATSKPYPTKQIAENKANEYLVWNRGTRTIELARRLFAFLENEAYDERTFGVR